MACTVASLQTDACASGIGRIQNPVVLLRVIAQTAANWAQARNPSLDVSVSAIQERACESGIGRVTDPKALYVLVATSLCDIKSATPVTPTVEITSIDPDPLSKFGGESVTLTGSGFLTVSDPQLSINLGNLNFVDVTVVNDTTITATSEIVFENVGEAVITLSDGASPVATINVTVS